MEFEQKNTPYHGVYTWPCMESYKSIPIYVNYIKLQMKSVHTGRKDDEARTQG